MKFATTAISGCKKLELEKLEDHRGFFARTWCADELTGAGLPSNIVQSSISYNRMAGTLRGMHLQLPPSKEGKFVRCVRGAIFDVVVDLRADSVTHMNVVTARLDDRNRDALFVPPGCAHGFQSLEDDSEVLYMMTDNYEPELSWGFRWDDPLFDIEWPIPNPGLHERDATYADFDRAFMDELRW